MGQTKALLNLHGAELVHHHVRALAPVARVVVVVGSQADAVAAAVRALDVDVVVNRQWASTHPADSLQLALDACEITGCCWVTPVDTPPAKPATLEVLTAHGAPGVPIGPDGAPGHPVLLGPEEVRAVRAAAPAGGLRALLRDAPRVAVTDPHVAIDFDTPEAWQAYRDRVNRQPLAR